MDYQQIRTHQAVKRNEMLARHRAALNDLLNSYNLAKAELKSRQAQELAGLENAQAQERAQYAARKRPRQDIDDRPMPEVGRSHAKKARIQIEPSLVSKLPEIPIERRPVPMKEPSGPSVHMPLPRTTTDTFRQATLNTESTKLRLQLKQAQAQLARLSKNAKAQGHRVPTAKKPTMMRPPTPVISSSSSEEEIAEPWTPPATPVTIGPKEPELPLDETRETTTQEPQTEEDQIDDPFEWLSNLSDSDTEDEETQIPSAQKPLPEQVDEHQEPQLSEDEQGE